jgi:ABC-type nitrate/sulfonate/bicarbonate transport system substrate-binding protein
MTEKRISRRQFVARSAVAIGGGAIGLAGLTTRARAATTALQVSYSKTAIHHSPFVYLTQNAEKYGFSIDLLNFDRYSDAMLAMENGQIQFGGLGYVNIPTLIDRKMTNVHMIAGNMMGGTELVIRKGVKINSWKDYEGLKIAVSANSMGEHHFKLDAIEHGFDIGKVKTVSMLPGPAALIALKQGEIDGLVAWEPWASQTVVDGIGYLPNFRLTDNSVGPINGLLGANAGYAAANRDVTTRFVKAMVDVDRYLTDHVDEHIKVAVGFMGIDPAVARKAIEDFTYDESMYIKPARAYCAIVYKYGLTKSDTSAHVSDVLDYSFLEAATGKPRAALGWS